MTDMYTAYNHETYEYQGDDFGKIGFSETVWYEYEYSE